ncbi:MAG: sigma 54-interacting transcriptional regulator [Candidatus Tectomicrobia bacterium]|uniref:Sigma 54-interacting transcriptional regulator n=1 Tax=Tectimicrobiota bacterium TaxID=2528274 RepID=A0A932CL41_UNCTE|nr:sigma 54-interacting transcriptional regulator [Candidatus Tectomicrobia bacterium]
MERSECIGALLGNLQENQKGLLMRIGTKLVVSLVLSIMVVMGIYRYWRLLKWHETLSAQQARQVRIAARVLTITVENAMRRDQREEVEGLFREIRGLRGIDRVTLFRADGSVLVASHPSAGGAAVAVPTIQQVLKEKKPVGFFSKEEGQGYFHYLTPMRPAWQGTPLVLEVVASTSFMEQILVQRRNEIVFAWVFMMMIIAFLAWYFTRQNISRPIGELIQGAMAIGSGDLSRRIPMERKDELGRLATEFNRMVENLERARDQLLEETRKKLDMEQQLQHLEKLAAAGRLAVGLAQEIETSSNIISSGAEYFAEDVRLRQEVEDRYRFGALIGKSRGMQEVFKLIPLVAPSSSHVLITGESGTGKELVAKAIHYHSPRRTKPFIPINCAAIPSELLESELFGHMKGAFSGAHISRKGLIETAEGGTLFLDEIADLSPPLQAKLLRVLQEKELWPVGGREGIKVAARFIAATNQDLWGQVEEGGFREDLYFRLAVIRIQLPPLRERPEDIPLLVDHFLKKYAEASGKEIRGVSEEALAHLLRRPWRGNIREMENLIEAGVSLAQGPILSLENLSPFLLSEASAGPRIPGLDTGEDRLSSLLPGKASAEAGGDQTTLEDMEKAHIAQALQKCGGNVAKAAALLGISRKTLYRKRKQYGLDSVSS